MTSRFEAIATPIAGLTRLRRLRLSDERGYFERLFCAEELAAWTDGKPIVQINHTFTRPVGTLRGLHYQRAPHAEIKLVQCLRGRVFDVVVDLRTESATYRCWHGEILSAEDASTLVIPEGMAHGFQTLCDSCELVYFHTAAYCPSAEAGLHPLDPILNIAWPEQVTAISERDSKHPRLEPLRS